MGPGTRVLQLPYGTDAFPCDINIRFKPGILRSVDDVTVNKENIKIQGDPMISSFWV